MPILPLLSDATLLLTGRNDMGTKPLAEYTSARRNTARSIWGRGKEKESEGLASEDFWWKFGGDWGRLGGDGRNGGDGDG